MNNIEDFYKYNLSNVTYDFINCYVVEEHDCVGLNLKGNLNDTNCEYKHYQMSFGGIKTPLPVEELNEFQEGTIKCISVQGDEKKGFEIKIVLETAGRIFDLDFISRSCYIHFQRYRGVDYTNVFGTEKYIEENNQFLYLEDEKYFEDETVIEITEEFSLVQKNYLHMDGMRLFCMSRNFLQKAGKTIHSYICIDGHHRPHKELIYHQNGHRYYPYHVDLYGISYIDVDSLEVFDYVPKGYDHDYDCVCGESFIVTGIHYDAKTNLVAYEGCYWADTMDVMVGDLSNPLNFNPVLKSIHEILDPEYEEFDDVDFVEWNENSLSVKIDGGEVRQVDKELFMLK